MIEKCYYESPIGPLLITADVSGVRGIDCVQTVDALKGDAEASDAIRAHLEAAVKWLDLYFSGQKPDFMPPIHLQGTPFQKTVWDVLLAIPYGETKTYGEVAMQVASILDKPQMSAQAIGGAVGKNPVLLVVPCHRVIGAGNRLTGYRPGLDKKRALLALEGLDVAKYI